MALYTKILNKLKTPQSQALPGAGQVPNSAGGYAWKVDRWAMFDRFLILGSENGTYYIGERKLTLDHASNAIAVIEQDGERAVSRIVEISTSGRAPKNDPAIFALAIAAAASDEKTRALALAALPKVCRTGTHLFSFAAAVDSLRGWGRGLRKAVGRWYNSQDPEKLAYQLVKYMQREGWSNRDLLRLAHPVPASEAHKVLYKWVVDDELTGPSPLLEAVKELKTANVADAAKLIAERKLPREALPTELLREKQIWAALLPDMPLTAIIRNLGNMSKCGLLTVGSEAAATVVRELGNVERLKRARIHPIALLNALVTYSGGRGHRGSGEWPVVPRVLDALDKAFYDAFANVDPTGKRYVLGLDVSGSMEGTRVAGLSSLGCREACGAMALVTLAAEQSVHCMAFDTSAYALKFSARQRLDDIVKKLAKTGGGGTDCSLPITWALKQKIEADVFVIYTDSETWYGSQHPSLAVQEYRKAMGIPAKLVVVAMASNKFSIGDTRDPLTLNVVGFDTSVPNVIAQFASA